ncbi:XRE family transcriptional regulator [Stutzerimonas nitrititolerans]|uniref:XRE family transcriptional regulator n=1 Tax=Stutzerimonas nitrititolerans TaxID=2482751 RepID=UPI0028A6A894|nr:XRE family transcriptional regulator [Stutzerimonas nitrititolerans]
MDSAKKKRPAKPNIKKAPPTPAQIRDARVKAGHTNAWSAANVVYVSTRQWQKYEAGSAVMSAAAFELYLLKTGQF